MFHSIHGTATPHPYPTPRTTPKTRRFCTNLLYIIAGLGVLTRSSVPTFSFLYFEEPFLRGFRSDRSDNHTDVPIESHFPYSSEENAVFAREITKYTSSQSDNNTS